MCVCVCVCGSSAAAECITHADRFEVVVVVEIVSRNGRDVKKGGKEREREESVLLHHSLTHSRTHAARIGRNRTDFGRSTGGGGGVVVNDD